MWYVTCPNDMLQFLRLGGWNNDLKTQEELLILIKKKSEKPAKICPTCKWNHEYLHFALECTFSIDDEQHISHRSMP